MARSLRIIFIFSLLLFLVVSTILVANGEEEDTSATGYNNLRIEQEDKFILSDFASR
jgi:hypothetical protein